MLKNKVAIVTGGSGGIGSCTVFKMAREGAKVVVADLRVEAAQSIVDEVKANGGEATAIAVDVSRYDSFEKLVDATVSQYGSLDVLFNNAGIAMPKPLLEMDPVADFDPTLAVNQKGVFYGILAAAKKMRDLKVSGTIINTSSIYATVAGEYTFAYNTSKAAVSMMTKSAALELAPHNIRVLGIAPGRINTPMLDGYKELGLYEHIKKEGMRGELIEPEDVASLVAFLASDQAPGMNGTIVDVDDGFLGFKFPLVPAS